MQEVWPTDITMNQPRVNNTTVVRQCPLCSAVRERRRSRRRRRTRARRLGRKAEAENETGIIPPTDVWEQAETLPAAQKETDYRDGSANGNAEGAGLVPMIGGGCVGGWHAEEKGSWTAAVQLKWKL